MKNKKTTAIILALLICAIAAIFILPDQQSESRERKLSREERKKARYEYFHRMLKDPVTNQIPKNVRARELAFAEANLSNTRGRSANDMFQYEWQEIGPSDIGGRTRAFAIDARDSDVLITGGVSGGIWKSTDAGTTWQYKLDDGDAQMISWITQDPNSLDIWYASMGENGFSGGSSAGDPYVGSGIYKSEDNGETWVLNNYEVTNSALISKIGTDDTRKFDFRENPTLQTTKILAHDLNGSTVLALATIGNGIWISDDGAETFTPYQLALTSNETPQYSEIIIDQNDNVTLWFGPTDSQDGGFFTSTTDVETFVNITPSDYQRPVAGARTVMAVAPSNANIVYSFSYLSGTDPEEIGFYKFDFTNFDGTQGLQIANRSSNMPEFEESIFGGPEKLSTQGAYDMAIAIHPEDENLVVIGYVSLAKSGDGFATSVNGDPLKYWIGGNESPYRQRNGTPFGSTHHADQHIAVFDPNNPDRLYMGHDGGISVTQDVTADLVTWSSLNNDLNITQYYDVSFARNEEVTWIAGGTQDNGTPLLDAAGFDGQLISSSADISTGDGAFTYVGNEFIYASAQYGALVITYTDSNGEADDFRFIEPIGQAGTLFIHPYTVDPNDEGTIFYPHATDGYIGRNTQVDEAVAAESKALIEDSWEQIDFPTFATVHSLKVTSAEPANRLYFGGTDTESGLAYLAYIDDANTVDVTNPNIQSITLESYGIDDNAFLSDIAINPYDGNEIMLVYSNYNITGLFHSSDGGATLTAVEGNLDTFEGGTDGDASYTGPSLRAAEIITDENDEVQKYVVATSVGIYSTEVLDGNNTVWSLETLKNIVVEDLDSRPADNTIIVGTHGRGMWGGTWSNAPANNAPEIADQSFTIEENSADGVVVGTVVATDPDQDPITYAITAGNTNDAFAIDQSSGELTVANSSALDFETTPSFSLTVEVTDDEPESSSATVTVNLSDVAENSAPSIENQVFTIDENLALDTSVGVVVASDAEGDALSFGIAAGNVDLAFSIDIESGELFVNNDVALDFETNPTFSLEVEVTDGELFSSAIITIELRDVDESEPLSVDSGNEFTVYPNPVKNRLYFDNKGDISELKLVDLSGKELKKFKVSRGMNTIELKGFEQGTYFLYSDTKEKKRIVINK